MSRELNELPTNLFHWKVACLRAKIEIVRNDPMAAILISKQAQERHEKFFPTDLSALTRQLLLARVARYEEAYIAAERLYESACWFALGRETKDNDLLAQIYDEWAEVLFLSGDVEHAATVYAFAFGLDSEGYNEFSHPLNSWRLARLSDMLAHAGAVGKAQQVLHLAQSLSQTDAELSYTTSPMYRSDYLPMLMQLRKIESWCL